MAHAPAIGAGRILKVEGHSGGSNYFGAKRRKKNLVRPTFDLSWARAGTDNRYET